MSSTNIEIVTDTQEIIAIYLAEVPTKGTAANTDYDAKYDACVTYKNNTTITKSIAALDSEEGIYDGQSLATNIFTVLTQYEEKIVSAHDSYESSSSGTELKTKVLEEAKKVYVASSLITSDTLKTAIENYGSNYYNQYYNISSENGNSNNSDWETLKAKINAVADAFVAANKSTTYTKKKFGTALEKYLTTARDTDKKFSAPTDSSIKSSYDTYMTKPSDFKE